MSTNADQLYNRFPLSPTDTLLYTGQENPRVVAFQLEALEAAKNDPTFGRLRTAYFEATARATPGYLNGPEGRGTDDTRLRSAMYRYRAGQTATEDALAAALGAVDGGVNHVFVDDAEEPFTYRQRTVLGEAVRQGNIDLVRMLLDNGADGAVDTTLTVDVQDIVRDVDVDYGGYSWPSAVSLGLTRNYTSQVPPVRVAAQMGRRDIVQLLADRQAYPRDYEHFVRAWLARKRT
jgi:hypothetical protein